MTIRILSLRRAAVLLFVCSSPCVGSVAQDSGSRAETPQTEAPSLQDDGNSRRSLLDEVAAIESGLRTLELEASCHVDRGPDGGGDLPGDLLLRVWRENVPKGRARITAEPEVWPSASGKLIESWSTQAFDGTYGYSLDDERDPVPTGRVIEGRPPVLMAWSNFTGWVGTIYGNFEEKGARLSEVLGSIGPNLRVEDDGGRVVATGESATSIRRWYFERRPSLVLVRYEHQQGPVLLREIEASGFLEVAPGVLFPSDVIDTLRDGEGHRRARRVIHCSDVVANSESFDSSVFVIEFPVGASVTDEVNDRQVRVGPDAEQLTSMIEERMQRARSESMVGDPAGRAFWWWGVPLALVLVGAGYGVLRRARSQPVLGLFLLAAILGGASREVPGQDAAARGDWLTPQVALRAQNCGVGAALCVLTGFDLPADPDRLAEELGCGAHWVEQTDLHRMAQVLRERGLLVRGYRNGDPEWLRSTLAEDRQQLAVVHTTAESGHFLVAYRADAHRIYVIDPNSNQGWVHTGITEQNREFWSQLTGMGLLIERQPAQWSLDGSQAVHVDLGQIESAADLPTFVSLPVVHRGDGELSITEAPVAGCSCVKSVVLVGRSDRLRPGESGQLRLAVATANWPIGLEERSAFVEVQQGGVARRVELRIRARVVARR